MGYRIMITAGRQSMFVKSIDNGALFYTDDEFGGEYFTEDRSQILHDIIDGFNSPFVPNYDCMLDDDDQYEDLSPSVNELGLEKIEFI